MSKDIFCGFCGRMLRAVETSVQLDQTYYWGVSFIQFHLYMKNTGLFPVQIEGFHYSINGQQETNDWTEPLNLEPGKSDEKQCPLQIPNKALSPHPIEISLKVDANVFNKPYLINLSEAPVIKILTNPKHNILYIEETSEPELEVHLPITVVNNTVCLSPQSPLQLQRLDHDPSEADSILKITPIGLVETKWHPNQNYHLSFKISKAIFNRDNSTPPAIQFCLLVLDEQGTTIPSMPFCLGVREEYKFEFFLETEENKRLNIPIGSQKIVPLFIRNLDQRSFHIESLQCFPNDKALGCHLEVKPFWVNGNNHSCFQVAPLTLDTTGLTEEQIIDLMIVSHLPNGIKKNDHLMIDVFTTTLKRVPLGIDLGNTNSVVAIMEEQKLRTLPLKTMAYNQEGFNPSIAPTISIYKPISPPQTSSIPDEMYWNAEEVEIESTGAEALSQLRSDPYKGTRTALLFKMKLGLQQFHHFPFMTKIHKSVESITADYFTKLLNDVEQSQRSQYRPVVLTHPVRFWYSQRVALRNAVKQTNKVPDDQLYFLDEATAVLLYDTRSRIFERKENIVGKKEVVLVFDFGGGTIDITLCQLYYKSTQDIKIEPISYDGTKYFGGDTITLKLAEKILEKAKQFLKGVVLHNNIPVFTLTSVGGIGGAVPLPNQRSDITEVIQHFEEDEEIPFFPWDMEIENQSQPLVREALFNFSNIYWEAEQFKIEDLSYGGERIFQNPNQFIRILNKKNNKFRDFSELEFQLPKEEVITLAINELKNKPIRMLKNLLDNWKAKSEEPSQCQVDRVLLSGQSSRMPLVSDLLREQMALFQNTPPVIELLDKAKEAVALGAAIYGYKLMRKQTPTRNNSALDSLMMNRVSRVYIYIMLDGIDGPEAFIELVSRFEPLPLVKRVIHTSQDSEFGFSVNMGDHFILCESFSDLINPMDETREDEDFRKLLNVEITPPVPWTEDLVAQATLELVITEDEQITLRLVPAISVVNSKILEPFVLWPRM